ncbi:MAG: LuxR C-terminal-related transcriptional regulator [Saprospiraceae bacterium]|nr:LuxR C-terminal-related transcriptional regulator [Saprospiraceae bacterium]
MLIRICVSSVLFLLTFIPNAFAEYEIKGKLNLSSGWQHQIFLSTIPKLDDYYKADPSNIIQVGNIEDDGSFILKGNNLPLEARYYRLYVIKEEHSEFDACIYVDRDDHNFIHIILDNTTKIDVQSDPNQYAPFGNYSIIGDKVNQSLRDLNMMIIPSYYFYQIKFPSELQFSKQKLNRDLFQFADSCEHILVSLAAMINTEMDHYYDIESEKYLEFGNRLGAQLNNHSYSDDYFRKMNYHSGDKQTSQLPTWIIILISSLAIALTVAFVKIFQLSKSLGEKSNQISEKQSQPFINITNQEEKILSLILQEKSNKEIASELFIELSTVKTHINKLYSKMGVKNRTEAKNMAKTLENIGV